MMMMILMTLMTMMMQVCEGLPGSHSSFLPTAALLPTRLSSSPTSSSSWSLLPTGWPCHHHRKFSKSLVNLKKILVWLFRDSSPLPDPLGRRHILLSSHHCSRHQKGAEHWFWFGLVNFVLHIIAFVNVHSFFTFVKDGFPYKSSWSPLYKIRFGWPWR